MAEDEKKVDEAWKDKIENARQDKGDEADASAGPRPPVPEASFAALLSSLAVQAMIGLGQIENPISKKREPDFEQAKFTIDTLQILADKTKGNLTDEEQKAPTSSFRLSRCATDAARATGPG